MHLIVLDIDIIELQPIWYGVQQINDIKLNVEVLIEAIGIYYYLLDQGFQVLYYLEQ